VRARGVEVHTCELGPADRGASAGPPLVLLHGIGDSYLTWSRVAGVLARRRRVILADLPGHGLSSRPDASYALAWHAEVMGAWLDALGLDEVDLVGHSFGGGVAQWLLLTHRARVRRLALVAPGGLGQSVSVALRLASLGVIEHVGQPFLALGTRIGLRSAGAFFTDAEIERMAWMSAQPGTARALSRTICDVIDLRGQRRHFLDRAAEIGELPPISLAWGDRDPVLPFAHAADAAALLEHVPLSRYEGSGHFPHRERAERFAEELEAFLDAASPRPARLRAAIQVQVPEAPERRPSALARAMHAVARGLRAALAFGLPPRPRPRPVALDAPLLRP